jgi:hypothetical protein
MLSNSRRQSSARTSGEKSSGSLITGSAPVKVSAAIQST